ncbi:hypothetical protein [Pontibacter pamirensis]|uniref:hypothetical protein n=1 Tax=Pontibacter pamirensis TaxID=2562824 RepID=UPI001389F7FD|nr:hypothetical protein [Pontibacter pamirensis]
MLGHCLLFRRAPASPSPKQPEKEAEGKQALRDDEKRQPEPDPKQVAKGKRAAGERKEEGEQ